jgi:hypothetical protein
MTTITNKTRVFLVVCFLLSFGFSHVARADILVPSDGDYFKFLASKAGQIFAPSQMISLVQKVEHRLKTKYPQAYEQYLDGKEKYLARLPKGIKIPAVSRERFNQFLAHGTWKVATDLPFIGASAFNLPALVVYSLTQVVAQEYLPERFNLAGKFEDIFAEYRPSLDIKLKSGQTIAVSAQKGKLKIYISPWTRDQWDRPHELDKLLKSVTYSKDKSIALIKLDAKYLGDDVFEDQLIEVQLKKNIKTITEKNIDKIKVISESASKKLVSETYFNEKGIRSIYETLGKFTTFGFESDGVGYKTSFGYMMHKWTRIVLASNIAWPMYEVGNQFWTSGGVLNLAPLYLHSYGLFTSFIFGGIIGSAVGSRAIDMTVMGYDRFFRRFPDLRGRLFPSINRFDWMSKKLPTRNKECMGPLEMLMRGDTKPTLDNIREALTTTYKWKYKAAVYSSSIIGGGTLAWALPQGYKKVSDGVSSYFRGSDPQSEKLLGGLSVPESKDDAPIMLPYPPMKTEIADESSQKIRINLKTEFKILENMSFYKDILYFNFLLQQVR